MADWCGVMGRGSGRVGGCGTRRSTRDEDFEEEDVWSVMKEIGDSSSNSKHPSSGSSSSSSAWHIPSTAPRMIPTTKPTPTNHGGKVVQQQSSAPVNIPDWSKIYGGKPRNKGSWADDDNGIAYDDGDNYHIEDDEGSEDDMVPPHEWLARKLARSQISSFSVCEGVGRTLKGRDLSKVRNAILTKTGFLE